MNICRKKISDLFCNIDIDIPRSFDCKRNYQPYKRPVAGTRGLIDYLQSIQTGKNTYIHLPEDASIDCLLPKAQEWLKLSIRKRVIDLKKYGKVTKLTEGYFEVEYSGIPGRWKFENDWYRRFLSNEITKYPSLDDSSENRQSE